MKKRFLCLLVLLFMALSAQNAGAVLLDFEDLNSGDSYVEGQSLYSSGVEIKVGELELAGGGTTSGDVFVGTGGLAGHLGKELVLSDVNLHFLLGDSSCPSCGISLLFGYYGGDVNIGINGIVKAYTSFFDIPSNENIGGASVNVRGDGTLGGLLIVNGPINTFTIGGEDIAIDSVLACEIPEPTTIALLGLSGLTLLLRRKRS